MKEQQKILRVFNMISFIGTKKRNIEEIAKEFDVDRRTVYRYVRLLELVGFDVKRTRKRNTLYYYIPNCADCIRDVFIKEELVDTESVLERARRESKRLREKLNR